MRRSKFFGAVGAILVLPAAAGAWAGVLRWSGNVHEVEPGELYRSAQLGPDQLKDVIDQHNIRTVVNLRGGAPGRDWYDKEVSASRNASVRHYDVSLSAKRQPDAATLASLREILRQAPRPLLIHCNGGADRSGLAAAIYELEIKGRTADDAAKQLTFWYGHFPWLGSKSNAMDQSFDAVVTSRTTN